MTSAKPSEPIVVFFKSQLCGPCRELYKYWNDIVKEIKTTMPNIRTTVVEALNNTGDISNTTKPRSISKIAHWFPLIFLCPGPEWDKAIMDDNYELKHGIQFMNSRTLNGGAIYHSPQYNTKNPKEFVNWLKVALENPTFKDVQAGTLISDREESICRNPGFTIPTRTIMPPLDQPKALPEKYIKTGTKSTCSSGDVCSMKIIPRYY